MHVETIRYRSEQGWSGAFPAMDSERTLVVVFGAPELVSHASAFTALRRAYPRARMLGCSSSGEIAGSSIVDGSLSVAIASFDDTALETALASVRASADSFGAGETLARALDRPSLRAILVLSDGIHVNGSELLRGVQSVVPPSVVITGGLAGDGDRFQSTWVLGPDGTPLASRVAAVGFYGPRVVVSHGSRGGWDIFGPERIITRSEGNVLYELDGQPALKLYKRYLGDRARGLPATALLFPLTIRSSSPEAPALVRTILSIDEARGSMAFAGDVPQGARAQLMSANFDRLIGGANAAGELAARGQESEENLCIAISCVGRRLVLGQRCEEEVEAVVQALRPGTKLVGFYSYGELSPLTSGRCELHNQTMTLTCISEA